MSKKTIQPTSHLANEHMDITGKKLRYSEIILQAMLCLDFVEGNTDRIANFAKLKREQVHKRLSEMEKQGLIFNTGKTNLLTTGRHGIVWKATVRKNILDSEIPIKKQKEKNNWISCLKCDGACIIDKKTVASFNQETEVAYNEYTTLRGDTVIYGEVKGVSEKKNTRATIRINNEYNLPFDVSKEIAIKLGSCLFKEVGLRGNARWDKATYRIIDFRVDSIIVLEDKSISDTFNELGKLLAH